MQYFNFKWLIPEFFREKLLPGLASGGWWSAATAANKAIFPRAITEKNKPERENSAAVTSPPPCPPKSPGRQVARPLVWVTLVFILGLAAPSWGLGIPGVWLLAGLPVLWLLLALAWWTRRTAGWLPLALFWLLGVAFYQQAEQPVFPPQHLTRLPLAQELSLRARL